MQNSNFPSDVLKILKLAKNVQYLPSDEQRQFPKMLIRFDGYRLPEDPEARLKKTNEIYKLLMDHFHTRQTFGWLPCPFTSGDYTTGDASLAAVKETEASMCLPHQQNFEDPIDSAEMWKRPDYVVMIECNLPHEDVLENFKDVAFTFKKQLAASRKQGPNELQ